MFYVSEIYNNKPDKYKNKLEEIVYNTLEELNISYERVETNEAITMEDCIEIDKKLNMKMVKTLFVTNRQKTNFYLFVICGDKRFDSKKFSSELNISRVSFADSSLMEEILNTKVGATTIFSVLIDKENKINVIIDKDVLNEEYYGCSDGTTTGYMKIKTEDIINKLLPYSNHKEIVIEM